jgi:DNA-binding transcriptional LysR family regulator
MELKWLEDIIVLLEEKSFSKASERRNVTQPAFSRRIKNVEDWLDCKIVNRGTQPITISDSAWSLEPEIRALAKRMYELKGRFRSADKHLSRLDIASQHTLAVSVFPDVISEMSKEYESLSYRLRAADKDDCITMCLRGDAGFLLSYETLTKQTELPEALFNKMIWGSDRLIPVVGGRLRYSMSTSPFSDQVLPLIGYSEDSFFGKVLSEEILPNVLHTYETEWKCEAVFTSSIKEICLAGVGMTWLPASLVRRELRSGDLVALVDEFDCCSLDIVLHARKEDDVASDIFDKLNKKISDKQYA